MRIPNYEIVSTSPTMLVVRDVGPWDIHPTITNGVERLIVDVQARGLLPPGKGLAYYDSEGQLDEIEYNERGFVRFKPYVR